MAFIADTHSITSSESVAPRPPTPPREASREAAVFLKSVHGRSGQSDPCSTLQTPPNATPTSGTADSNSKSRRKKVEWSAHTEYKDHVDIRRIERLTRSSPISALSPKPIKGILKQSSPLSCAASFGSNFDGSTDQLNIIEMLESTIKQLAGSDRDSKLDAYMTLSRALKASNNLPDRVALQNKMSLFMQFIQRDVCFKTTNGNFDTSLTNHSLTLLVTFLHFPAIASTLTADFGIFILDYSIRAFQDAATPKDVVRHLMQVVAFQNFPVKVMTSERVGRLINALHHIEDHVTGKSIVMSRIHIYRRLVKQSRNHMASHLDWLEDMFMDMLSAVKDIRTQAIALATEAGFALRSEKQLMRKASEIFQTVDVDQTYIESYIQRLDGMLREKQSSTAVPQIWSAMILYMRCPLERWQHYGPWLTLVQSAFNMADGFTKQEANYAWNRYVCLALQDTKVSSKVLGTLCQPLISQLRRKTNPRFVEEGAKLRRTVIGGICNLYYYVFAPGNDKYSPDLLWDVAVEPIMAQLILLDGKPEIFGDCLMQAARILAGLLDVTTPRIWKQDRIQEMPPVRPDELPALDAKWIRQNCDKITRAVCPILEKKFLDLVNKESMTFRLWQVLVGSVAVASAKDIKVSEDTVKFFACTFGLLAKVWTAGNFGNDGLLNPNFFPSVQNFISVLIDALGVLPFTEKKLSLSATNIYEPLTTPRQLDRPGKSNAGVRIALHHLFIMLSSIPAGGADDDAMADFLVSVFEPFLSGRTQGGRAELVSELLLLLPRDSPSSYGSWLLAAQNLPLSLETLDGSTRSSAEANKVVGPQYRDIVSLLERGFTAHPNLPADQWVSLFNRLSEHVAREFGDAGRSIVLVEPLAKTLLEKYSIKFETPSLTSLRAAKALFDVAQFPRDQASLEVARRRLWGVPLTASRSGIADPLEHLCKLGNHLFRLFYNQFSAFDSENFISPFIKSVNDFLTRSFPSSNFRALSKLQDGLCIWIRDDDRFLQPSENDLLSKSVLKAWREISTELACRKHLDRTEVDQIEPLLIAAFQSKHNGIVARAVEIWNALTQDEKSLDCSESLQSIASGLGSKANLVTGESSGGVGAQASSLPQSQGDVSLVVLSSASSSQKDVRPVSSPPLSDSPAISKRVTRKRPPEATSVSTRAKSAKRVASPRLRHDDSQIQFVPVTASPPPAQDDDESQHLTERQQEVRERQRENAALYSDQIDTSPIRLLMNSQKPGENVACEQKGQEGGETPQRPALYKKLASSTPTPRRGQPTQLEDADLPSSPPEPRPYPLLSEIKSRLRDKTFLEDWEFSSPPETPATSHKQEPENQGLVLPSIENTGFPKINKTRAFVSNDTRAAASDEEIHIEMKAMVEDEAGAVAEDVGSPAAKGEQEMHLENRSEVMTKAEESPRSVDDEFVDAKSSPDAPISAPEAPGVGNDSADTSFALSELDDSCMLKLIVEVQAQNNDRDQDQSDENPSKKQQEKSDDDRLEMPAGRDTLSLRSSQRPNICMPRSVPSTVPSTPMEVTETPNRSRSRRKRKQSGAAPSGDGGSEKKRRVDSEGPVEPHVTPKTPKTAKTAQQQIVAPERSLRRSSRKRVCRRHLQQETEPEQEQKQEQGEQQEEQRQQKQEEQQEESSSSKEDEKEAEAPRRRPGRPKRKQQDADVGDTDEEVSSQLVEESMAISQDQIQSEQSKKGKEQEQEQEQEQETDKTHKTGDGNLDPTEAAEAPERDDAKASAHIERASEVKVSSLLNTLQIGLDGLRTASLSREEVYKMEDLLMDMKRELFAAEKRGRGR